MQAERSFTPTTILIILFFVWMKKLPATTLICFVILNFLIRFCPKHFYEGDKNLMESRHVLLNNILLIPTGSWCNVCRQYWPLKWR